MVSSKSLRSSRDFRHVMSTGRRVKVPFGTLFVAPSAGGSRLGLAVPRAVGGAVVRNRIKRRLRAVFRSVRAGDLDVVVRANPAAATMRFQEMETVMSEAVGG